MELKEKIRIRESKIFEILINNFPDYNVPFCTEVAELIAKELSLSIESSLPSDEEKCIHQWQEVWKDHNHFNQSSWGANRCMKCGEIDEWQYDSPSQLTTNN